MIQKLLLPYILHFSLIWGIGIAYNNGGNTPPSIRMDNNDWRIWSPSELERQVSPSRWNPTKTPDQVIDEYITSSIKLTKLARRLIPNNLNIVYGSLPSEKFDLYGADLPEDSPIFVYIHGGYWQEGSKDISGISAPLNHKNGFKTVAFGYTVAPDAKIKDMEEELISCLKVLIKMYPKAKLILAGHSAGAQLAASLLHSITLQKEIANQIFGLILISGVYDLQPLVSTYVNIPLKMDQKEAESLSTLLLPFNNIIHFENLKTLVLVGGYDSPEFQKQSLEYYEKLKGKTQQQQTSFYKSESDDHFTIVQNLAVESSNSYKSVHEFLKNFTSKHSSSGIGLSSTSVLPISLLCLFIEYSNSIF